MPRHPSVYAELLAEKLTKHKADCWLVNTGWTGGPYGVGSRMKINVTRALLKAALGGSLADAGMETDPIFGVLVPQDAPGVPKEVLNPRGTWKDPGAYDRQANRLAGMFQKNFAQFEEGTPANVIAAGPRTEGMGAEAAPSVGH
jgi:phosphoenolpyruvate carboxykinase (ATP)